MLFLSTNRALEFDITSEWEIQVHKKRASKRGTAGSDEGLSFRKGIPLQPEVGSSFLWVLTCLESKQGLYYRLGQG